MLDNEFVAVYKQGFMSDGVNGIPQQFYHMYLHILRTIWKSEPLSDAADIFDSPLPGFFWPLQYSHHFFNPSVQLFLVINRPLDAIQGSNGLKIGVISYFGNLCPLFQFLVGSKKNPSSSELHSLAIQSYLAAKKSQLKPKQKGSRVNQPSHM
jgi:hypothetical protein